LDIKYLDEREGNGSDLILENDRARLFKVSYWIEEGFGVVGIIKKTTIPAVSDEDQSPVDDVQRESTLIFILLLHFGKNFSFMSQKESSLFHRLQCRVFVP